jgi:hypothetical protein
MREFLKALFRIFDLLSPEPKLGPWDVHKARMRAPYLADLERRFGREFVEKVRSVCTYPVTENGKTRFCGKTGVHDGIIGKLCDEHREYLNRLPPGRVCSG